jgi:glycosyltransferase involved in cell wall biosynthesis
MMTISIIIPVYNVQDYIGSCLDSIFAQEMEGVDIECILVDDCSSDNSLHIINKKLGEYRGNIHFIIKQLESNQGHCIARNKGIEVAKGEYLLFVDADDHLETDAISYFSKNLHSIEESSKIDIIMGNAYSRYSSMPIKPISDEQPVLIDNVHEEALHKILAQEWFHTSWNKMIKRDFLKENQLYFEPGIINEDLLWSYLVFRKARQVLYLPRVTYIYEDNPQSITRTSSQKIAKIIRSRTIECNKILDTPPKRICQEYFYYLFFILMRAINLFELNQQEVLQLQDELYKVRKRLLNEVWNNGYYVIYAFFLTSEKPYYNITRLRLFRRYYDRIAKFVVWLSKLIHEPWFSRSKIS